MVKPTREEMNQKRLQVCDFAQEHHLLINPAKGFEQVLDAFMRFGFCPCDPTRARTSCPCNLALADVAEKGHCLCRLFWRDFETFKRIYEEVDDDGNSKADAEENSNSA